MRLRPLAFATFLVWRLRIGACGVGACDFWRLWQLPANTTWISSRGGYVTMKEYFSMMWRRQSKIFCKSNIRFTFDFGGQQLICCQKWVMTIHFAFRSCLKFTPFGQGAEHLDRIASTPRYHNHISSKVHHVTLHASANKHLFPIMVAHCLSVSRFAIIGRSFIDDPCPGEVLQNDNSQSEVFARRRLFGWEQSGIRTEQDENCPRWDCSRRKLPRRTKLSKVKSGSNKPKYSFQEGCQEGAAL